MSINLWKYCRKIEIQRAREKRRRRKKKWFWICAIYILSAYCTVHFLCIDRTRTERKRRLIEQKLKCPLWISIECDATLSIIYDLTFFSFSVSFSLSLSTSKSLLQQNLPNIFFPVKKYTVSLKSNRTSKLMLIRLKKVISWNFAPEIRRRTKWLCDMIQIRTHLQCHFAKLEWWKVLYCSSLVQFTRKEKMLRIFH